MDSKGEGRGGEGREERRGEGIFAQNKPKAVRVTLRGSNRHPTAPHQLLHISRWAGSGGACHSSGVTVHGGMVRYVSGARSVLLLPTHPPIHPY